MNQEGIIFVYLNIEFYSVHILKGKEISYVVAKLKTLDFMKTFTTILVR